MSEGEPPFRYSAKLAGEIEQRWQQRWADDGTFDSPNPSGPLAGGFDQMAGRPKSYVLDMFPYPSGAGLHVGHPLGYIATDVHARYLRMTGHHVLHTFGYDAFGLPAEQYAIDTGQHPRVTVAANIAAMRRQLRRLGLAHDTRREVSTTDPAYYKWTQWIFLRMFGSWCDERTGRARPIEVLEAEYAAGARPTPDGSAWSELTDAQRRAIIDSRRLAYLSDELVNWCPALGTVLANEEVTADGRSDVGNHPVYRRPLRQWMLRITEFAGRLADDLDRLDWPESLKQMQRNWIAGLRDWLFSRQRYWGEPFPIVYDESGLPVALPDDALPVELPEIVEFRPVPAADPAADPVPPLARAAGWASVELDLGAGRRTYRRELNTMPQWAGSCWYYLRYLDPTNEGEFVGPEIERYWLAGSADGVGRGVDLYVGGVEHAVLHLLYARFWHKVLHDLGYVSSDEPFRRLVLHGFVLADAFTDERGRYVPAAEVVTGPDGVPRRGGAAVTRRAGKMGKSLKNGVSPDEIYDTYGADTLRLHEMAMGPLETDRPWQTEDIAGMHRFLQRLWRAIIDESTGLAAVTDDGLDDATARALHRTIAAVRADLGGLRCNTAIARLIELTSVAARVAAGDGQPHGLPRALAEPLVLMVAPLAPHIAEELWSRLGHPESLAYGPFPVADERLAADQVIRLPVQINSKTRFTLDVPAGAGHAEIESLVRSAPEFARLTRDLPVLRLVIVPGRIANVVTG